MCSRFHYPSPFQLGPHGGFEPELDKPLKLDFLTEQKAYVFQV